MEAIRVDNNKTKIDQESLRTKYICGKCKHASWAVYLKAAVCHKKKISILKGNTITEVITECDLFEKTGY